MREEKLQRKIEFIFFFSLCRRELEEGISSPGCLLSLRATASASRRGGQGVRTKGTKSALLFISIYFFFNCTFIVRRPSSLGLLVCSGLYTATILTQHEAEPGEGSQDGDGEAGEREPMLGGVRRRGEAANEERGVEAKTPEGDNPDLPRAAPPHLLGQWSATEISGNDLLSSILYTSGLCAVNAGVWAPVCLLMVMMMLYFYRAICGEVCSALPLNGPQLGFLSSLRCFSFALLFPARWGV